MAGQLTRWPLIVGAGVFLCWEVLGGLALSLLIWQRDASLRRQARVYEAAFRDLVEGVVVADPNGKFLLFNPAAERILGTGPRDVGVPEWSATYGCFYPDAQTPFPPEQLPLARALRGETAREDVFIRNSGVPNGEWISISGAPLRDEQGAVEGGAVTPATGPGTSWPGPSQQRRPDRPSLFSATTCGPARAGCSIAGRSCRRC